MLPNSRQQIRRLLWSNPIIHPTSKSNLTKMEWGLTMEQSITNDWNRCTKCLNKSVTWKAHKLLWRLMYFPPCFPNILKVFSWIFHMLHRKSLSNMLRVLNKERNGKNDTHLSEDHYRPMPYRSSQQWNLLNYQLLRGLRLILLTPLKKIKKTAVFLLGKCM